MFIFYDIETTGTNVVYDQILQFGAILVDENLVEIDRFEIRTRLLPWITPSPSALIVTGTPVSRLEDSSLSDFFSVMREIQTRLIKWGAATFVGYNSMVFDEPILQRAFWQSLLPPYLTVTGGNARLDLLPLLRAAAYFRPEFLKLPWRDDGSPSFRLDKLAPANGFNSHRAHDAMGDVEATLFLARKVASGFPELWLPLSARASKSSSVAMLNSGAPIFLFHHRGIPTAAYYQRIDNGRAVGSYAILAHLGYDWQNEKANTDSTSAGKSAATRKALRRVALNKAPLLFTCAEAEAIAEVIPEPAELAQAEFLKSDETYCLHLTSDCEPPIRPSAIEGAEVEETIFDGFATPAEQRRMADFHRANPPERLMLARAFDDFRFRRLAMRILYVQAGHLLSPREHEQIQIGIARRLKAKAIDHHPWRSICDAIAELQIESGREPTPEDAAILAWLMERKSTADADRD